MEKVDHYKCRGPTSNMEMMDVTVTTVSTDNSYGRTVDCDSLDVCGLSGGDAYCSNVPGIIKHCVFFEGPNRAGTYKVEKK